MRYMLLIYSSENEIGRCSPEEQERIRATHRAIMEEASRRDALLGAGPLHPTWIATTVRIQNGRTLITDGPFAATEEQLAGYYILDCDNLDEAIEWAAKIPTGCKGSEGSIEIRPLPGVPARPKEIGAEAAASRDR